MRLIVLRELEDAGSLTGLETLDAVASFACYLDVSRPVYALLHEMRDDGLLTASDGRPPRYAISERGRREAERLAWRCWPRLRDVLVGLNVCIGCLSPRDRRTDAGAMAARGAWTRLDGGGAHGDGGGARDAGRPRSGAPSRRTVAPFTNLRRAFTGRRLMEIRRSGRFAPGWGARVLRLHRPGRDRHPAGRSGARGTSRAAGRGRPLADDLADNDDAPSPEEVERVDWCFGAARRPRSAAAGPWPPPRTRQLALARRLLAIAGAAFLAASLLAPVAVVAAEPLSVTTPYPAVVGGARLQGVLQPQRLGDRAAPGGPRVSGVPEGWTASLRGGGYVVTGGPGRAGDARRRSVSTSPSRPTPPRRTYQLTVTATSGPAAQRAPHRRSRSARRPPAPSR